MDTRRRQVLDAYPKFRDQYLRTFSKMLEKRREAGLSTEWKNEEEVMEWWLGK